MGIARWVSIGVLWGLCVVQSSQASPLLQPLFGNKQTLSWTAPARVPLADPLTSSEANSAFYAFLPRVGGIIAKQLTTAYPVLSKNIGLRLLEYTTFFVGEVPWMVLSHEQGHYRVGMNFGWEPSIRFLSWASAVTPSHMSPEATTAQRQIFGAAGINQGQLNALALYQDWSRNEKTRYTDTLAYVLTKTNFLLYTFRSAAHLNPNSRADDIDGLVELSARRGKPISFNQLVTASTLTTLLSGNLWAAILGQAQFITEGTRRTPAPQVSFQKWRLFTPELYTFATTEGLIVGGQEMIQTPAEFSVVLEADASIDGRLGAVGVHLYDLPFAPWLHANPYVRVSLTPNRDMGIATGLELMWNIVGPVSLLGKLEYQRKDMLAEVTGKPEGLQGIASVGLHL